MLIVTGTGIRQRKRLDCECRSFCTLLIEKLYFRGRTSRRLPLPVMLYSGLLTSTYALSISSSSVNPFCSLIVTVSLSD